MLINKTNKILIIGASGQGKNIALLIEQIGGYEIIGFVDDNLEKKDQIIKGYPVLGNLDKVLEKFQEINVALAIGNSKVLEKIVTKLKNINNKQIYFPNLIHPTSQFNQTDVQMQEGNIVNANVIFTTDINIGSYNYFNRCCSISHDVKIGNFCLIHAGVHLSGNSNLGNKVWFGVGSTIIQGLKINNNVTRGAGAVILKDVKENAIMVGNPARLLRYKEVKK